MILIVLFDFDFKDHNHLLNKLNHKQNNETLSIFENYLTSNYEKEIQTTRHQSEIKLSRRAGLKQRMLPSIDLVHKNENSLSQENVKLSLKKSSVRIEKLLPDHLIKKNRSLGSLTQRSPQVSIQEILLSRLSPGLIDQNVTGKNLERDFVSRAELVSDDNEHYTSINTQNRETTLTNKDIVKQRLAPIFKEIDAKVNEPRKNIILKLNIGSSMVTPEDTECLSPTKLKASGRSKSPKSVTPIVHSMIQSSLLEEFSVMSKGIAFNEIIKERLDQRQKVLSEQKERQPQPFIPDWLIKNQDYINKYNNTKFYRKYPISELMAKKPDLRTVQENQEIADWLVKLDLFSSYNYHLLLDLGLKFYLITLKKGEILCHFGEEADSLFIVYEGELQIDINGDIHGIFKAGEYIGRAALDKDGLKRSATLKAMRETKVFGLDKNDYRSIISIDSNSKVTDRYGFISNYPFYRHFDEQKLKIFCKQLKYRKVYKNEIIYDFGEKGDYMFIMYAGKLNRQIKLETDKQNKWPTSLRSWQVSKVVKSFLVELPIEIGHLFGGRDMIYAGERKEKIFAAEDSSVFFMERETFLASKI